VDNRPPSGAYKGTSGGLAICLSACADEDLAADTSVRYMPFDKVLSLRM